MRQCANSREDLDDAILILNADWLHNDGSKHLTPDLVVGSWSDKADWLITLDATSDEMNNGERKTLPNHLLWVMDQTYTRCKMFHLNIATAGDQASMRALQQPPRPAPQRPAPQLQYEGPPHDMTGGPRGHALINIASRNTRNNAIPAAHVGPGNLEAWMQIQAAAAGNSSSHFELFEVQRTQGHTSKVSGGTHWETFLSVPSKACATPGSVGRNTPWHAISTGKHTLRRKVPTRHYTHMRSPTRTLLRP